MLTHWNKLLNTDCLVVKTGVHTVYPIFRVGWSTLTAVCDTTFVNGEIKKCRHIDVMIRDPEQRFVSGVNQYCVENSLDVHKVSQAISAGELVDRHFAPQYIWLLHLSRYYRGEITLRPFTHIKKITNVHQNKSKSKIKVPVCAPFVDVDYKLIKYLGQTLSLPDLVRRYKNVLS